jgi:8-amino-7-oxononanoate synthase
VFHVTHQSNGLSSAEDGHGPLAFLEAELAALDAAGLRRRAPPPLDEPARSFCSNDYLGLAGRVPAAAGASSGAGASRLIAGERAAHRTMEEAFARWLGVEACLAFSSGYAANVGTLAALAGPDDLIVSDALNHASLIDGARLSRARVIVTQHNDVDAVARALSTRKEKRAWVVVESYYSMDADGPDLRGLRRLCTASGAALYVDEAHALGVLGPDGRGRSAAADVLPDVLVGTMGKAFGSQGAFVAGPRVLRDWLWNRARSFVFSTGIAPVCAIAARDALDEIIRRPELRAHVTAMAERLRRGLASLDLPILGFGHVVPVVLGSTDNAMRLSAALADEGVVIPAIRPPTVADGTARLRLTVTARHDAEAIDALLRAFARALPRARQR